MPAGLEAGLRLQNKMPRSGGEDQEACRVATERRGVQSQRPGQLGPRQTLQPPKTATPTTTRAGNPTQKAHGRRDTGSGAGQKRISPD